MKKIIKNSINDLVYLVFPEVCHICKTSLTYSEKHICNNCLYSLPLFDNASYTENKACERFIGKIDFNKAVSAFQYQKGSCIQLLLEDIKYKGDKYLGEYLGAFAGNILKKGGFFDDIDVIVPVPLHPNRLKTRGYNQSEWIAKGLSASAEVKTNFKNLIRSTNNYTQTTRGIYERWMNVSTIFSVVDNEYFINKHVLIVDDVLTSGSTLEACGQIFKSIEGVKISFFSLAIA